MLRFQLGDALLGSLLFGFQLAVAVGLGARELLRALFDLRAQLGDRLLRGGQTLFERVLRAGRGRIGLGELVALTLGGGELVTQLCICLLYTSCIPLFRRAPRPSAQRQ